MTCSSSMRDGASNSGGWLEPTWRAPPSPLAWAAPVASARQQPTSRTVFPNVCRAEMTGLDRELSRNCPRLRWSNSRNSPDVPGAGHRQELVFLQTEFSA
jgi:hypothetical protein